MLAAGVIEPSDSPWASPKSQMAPIASVSTIGASTPSPAKMPTRFLIFRTPLTVCGGGGAKYFATIDLLSGYWQIGTTPRAQERSAFCTRMGLYHFKRMPFGLSNAPATFCTGYCGTTCGVFVYAISMTS